jgi:DNA-binding MarR family transcriptional regulator
MPTLTSRPERLDRAMSLLARRGTLTRLHRKLERAAGVDIDRAGYLVLRRIHHDGAMRVGDVAELMGVEPSTASRHIQALERRGWLEKHTDSHDGRVALVDQTVAGAELVERIESERHRILDVALSGWTDRELDVFVESFERFANDLFDAVSETRERAGS